VTLSCASAPPLSPRPRPTVSHSYATGLGAGETAAMVIMWVGRCQGKGVNIRQCRTVGGLGSGAELGRSARLAVWPCVYTTLHKY